MPRLGLYPDEYEIHLHGPGFRVDGFLAALLGALIISVVSFVLSRAVTRSL
jgi:uncharacterized membrane protein YvlD (DUF360 family)